MAAGRHSIPLPLAPLSCRREGPLVGHVHSRRRRGWAPAARCNDTASHLDPERFAL